MIRGRFVTMTRPDAFDLAIWIKSKTLRFHTSHKRCISYRFAEMLR
jgi:cytochrome P450